MKKFTLKEAGKKVVAVAATGYAMAQIGTAQAASLVDQTVIDGHATDGSDTIKALGTFALGLVILVSLFKKSQSAAR